MKRDKVKLRCIEGNDYITKGRIYEADRSDWGYDIRDDRGEHYGLSRDYMKGKLEVIKDLPYPPKQPIDNIEDLIPYVKDIGDDEGRLRKFLLWDKVEDGRDIITSDFWEEIKGGNDEISKTIYLINKYVTKTENMKTITRVQLKEIHDAACSTWRDNINTMFDNQRFEDKLEVSPSQIKELYSEADADQKKVLNKFFEEEVKIEFSRDNIYAINTERGVSKLHRVDESTGSNADYSFVNIKGSTQYAKGVHQGGQNTIDNSISDGIEVHTFDNQRDFLKWAIEVTK